MLQSDFLHLLNHSAVEQIGLFPQMNSFENCSSSMEEDYSGVIEWIVRQKEMDNTPDLSPVSSDSSIESSFVSLVLPSRDTEIDDSLTILHLLKAFGEASQLEQGLLVREVTTRLKEKSSPIGSTLERISHHLVQVLEKQANYLTTQSGKNAEAAFKAFYRIFPYGRFAHFAANSAIVEAIPVTAQIVHIVDFNINKGEQWPSLIEELAIKGNIFVRLISVKSESDEFYSVWDSFTSTKRRLYEQARVSGLRMKIEEMDMEDLANEMNVIKRRNSRTEWLTFNCMIDLPHMAKISDVKQVIEFLALAKDSIHDPFNRGIITIGNVVGFETGLCFEERLLQLQAFFESMEWQFPSEFLEARMTMECLFMSSQISHLLGCPNWTQSKIFEALGLIGREIGHGNVNEAKQLVREGQSLYCVKTDGEFGNQMILEYSGTPLVSVSCWQ